MIYLANGLALAFCAYEDYLGKKCVEKDKLDGPAALTAAEGIICLLIAMGLYAFHLGESGNAPWIILAQMPAVRWCAVCTGLYTLINLLAFRYIGITIENVTFTFGAVFMLVGMVLIYLFSGKLGDVAALLQPLPLMCIVLTLSGVFLLPYVDGIGVPKERRMPREFDRLRNDRKKMLIGIVLIIASSAFDAGDSLITSVAFSEEEANSMDYSIATFFAIFLLYMFIALALAVKRRRWVNVFRRGQGGYMALRFGLRFCRSSSTMGYVAGRCPGQQRLDHLSGYSHTGRKNFAEGKVLPAAVCVHGRGTAVQPGLLPVRL